MQAADLISSEYLAQIRELHSLRAWGDGGHKYAGQVRALVCEVDARSVLDYGCGMGTLRHGIRDCAVCEYDPGIPGKDALPSPADVVVCSDVLEHIEPDYLDRVLGHLRGLTRKVCFAVISTRLAHTTFPDGSNVHLIVEDATWWLEKLACWDWIIEVREQDETQLVVCLRV